MIIPILWMCEKTHTILVGAKDEEKNGVEPFVEKKLADLMESAQEPEAEIQEPE